MICFPLIANASQPALTPQEASQAEIEFIKNGVETAKKLAYLAGDILILAMQKCLAQGDDYQTAKEIIKTAKEQIQVSVQTIDGYIETTNKLARNSVVLNGARQFEECARQARSWLQKAIEQEKQFVGFELYKQHELKQQQLKQTQTFGIKSSATSTQAKTSAEMIPGKKR